MEPDPKDVEALLREKHDGTRTEDFEEDLERLRQGEPLAYVIGHIPFMGLSIALDSRPLIPRPETEWWTEEVIARIADAPLNVLDMCAGSGAIGLAILKHCPNAQVSFGELSEADCDQIAQNIERNQLDASRASIRHGDLFAPFTGQTFDLITTNPPYIPETRELAASLTYEPREALYAGSDGLSIIRRILADAPRYIRPSGELWMECDVDNIAAAQALVPTSEIRNDQYGRPRLLVAYY